jgi:SAM-dependent methyltransferase
MLWYLKRIGFQNVSGIDISKDQIELAKAKGFDVACVDAMTFLSEHEGKYDVIIAIDVIEHFTKPELFELLELIYRALNFGGLLIVQTPNGDGLMPNYVIYGDLTHFTILSPLSLTHILTITGFADIHIRELGLGFFVHFPLFILWQVIRLIAMAIKFFEIGRVQKYWTESIIGVCRKPNSQGDIKQ